MFNVAVPDKVNTYLTTLQSGRGGLMTVVGIYSRQQATK